MTAPFVQPAPQRRSLGTSGVFHVADPSPAVDEAALAPMTAGAKRMDKVTRERLAKLAARTPAVIAAEREKIEAGYAEESALNRHLAQNPLASPDTKPASAFGSARS